MTTMLQIAERRYPMDDLNTAIEYVARDIVLRNTADNSLIIRYTTNGFPGEADIEAPMTLEHFFEWRRELPEQVSFVVFRCHDRSSSIN
jgi:hypothetical protein